MGGKEEKGRKKKKRPHKVEACSYSPRLAGEKKAQIQSESQRWPPTGNERTVQYFMFLIFLVSVHMYVEVFHVYYSFKSRSQKMKAGCYSAFVAVMV